MKQHSPAFLELVTNARAHVPERTIDETRARLSDNPHAVLVDVREDSEWANGHAAGAIHLGKGIIERDIEKQVPDKSTELILYCGGGFRSILSAEALQKMGYTNVASMAGGWRAWRDSNAPTDGI